MAPHGIEHLKTLLRRMQQEDPHFRVFGAVQHHYCLGPTLTEEGLAAFEREHGVRLPEGYRAFLSNGGNGGPGPHSPLFMGKSGAGPFYGLLSLADAAVDSRLGEPFPFTEATEGLPEGAVEALIDPDLFPGVPGALALCHGGSGLVYYLVVNGPAYGTIWQGRENFYPMAPSFDAWYGRWARRLSEHALPRLASERAIRAAHVGMSLAEVIALGGDGWELKPWSEGRSGRKMDLRFPHLSTQFEVEDDVVVRVIAHDTYC